MKTDLSQLSGIVSFARPASADDEEQALIRNPALLPLGISFALLMLGFGLWLVAETGLIAASRGAVAWDLAIRSPIDRRAPLSIGSTEIVLQRSRCFGECPEYAIRIGGDGKIAFYGRHYVCAFGARTSRIDPHGVRHLVHAMEAAEFHRLTLSRSPVPDAATTTVSLAHEGRSHHVAFQRMDDDLLVAIGDEIDRLANSSQWLPMHSSLGQPYCTKADGSTERARFSE